MTPVSFDVVNNHRCPIRQHRGHLDPALLFFDFLAPVLGVGMARGISAIDLSVVGRIFLSWAITIPVGAVLSIIFFYVLRAILG